MTPCIRRSHAYWTTCTCGPCSEDRRRKAKIARTVGHRRISSEAAWVVIDDLLRRGWTGRAIASAAGIPRSGVEGALADFRNRGYRTTFGPLYAARIVRHGRPTEGQVGATGARRRLQGLAAQGWDLRRLSELTGLGASTLAAIRGGRTDRINAAVANAITDATARIGMTVGPSEPARLHATRAGWVGVIAWDDPDNPDETHGNEQQPGDEQVVDRILAGDWRLKATHDQRLQVIDRWLADGGIQNELARLTGWNVSRLLRSRKEAA